MMMTKLELLNKQLDKKIMKASNLLTSSSEEFKEEGYDNSDEGMLGAYKMGGPIKLPKFNNLFVPDHQGGNNFATMAAFQSKPKVF